MVSTVAPRMTNSPRGGSGAPGPAADRETACWARSSPDTAISAPSAVAPLSMVRRLIRVRVIFDLPVSQCS